MSILVMVPVSGCQKYCPFSTIFLYFQFQTATESAETSLVLWHHWLTTFPNLWIPFHAFIMYHPWTPQVHWIFFTETMRQLIPLLLFGLCGFIWGWLWCSVPKYRYLFFFWHRLRFKLAVLGCSTMSPGQRTVILEDWNKQHSGCTQRCSAF